MDVGKQADEEAPLPPEYVQRLTMLRSFRHASHQQHQSHGFKFASGLDFERVVNHYSIQATRDRLLTITKVAAISPDKGVQPPRVSYEAIDSLPLPNYDSSSLDQKTPTKAWGRRELRVLESSTGESVARWVLSILTGLLTGFCAVLIVTCTDTIQEYRSQWLDQFWKSHEEGPLFWYYASINLVLALLSSLLVIYVAPEGGGSGLPEAKAYLNGVRVKRFSSFKLLIVKIVGTILSVSSGLAIGPEGPLVHIGCIIGSLLSKVSTLFLKLFPALHEINHDLFSFLSVDLSQFSTDGERRDLIAIGAASGFAAAFGAPIGGLLFTVEEASSFFGHALFVKALTATALATFCMAVHRGDLSKYGIISLGGFNSANTNIFLNRVEELPLYVLMGVAGGVLGGIFVRIWKSLQMLRRSTRVGFFGTKSWLICEVAIVSLLSSTIMYAIPLMKWTCHGTHGKLTDEFQQEHQHNFDCPPGEFDEVANIFFGNREEAIREILSSPEKFDPWSLLIVAAVFFPLMTMTLGTALPTGVFMPTVLIGTSFGGFVGLMFEKLVGSEDGSASTFALLGAAAFLAGAQRSTVSLCVILVEGTGQVKVLIPVIITVVVARFVADMVYEHGLYETGIEVNKYPYLEHEDKRAMDIFQVKDIMSFQPVTVGPQEEASNIVDLLQTYNHHGFPVVDPKSSKFLGLVRRDQLVALLECGVFIDGDWDSEDDQSSEEFEGFLEGTGGTPIRNVTKSPLLNLALHIKDDRYDHMERNSLVASTNVPKPLLEPPDEYDEHAWLLAVRQSNTSKHVPPPPPLPGSDSAKSQQRKYPPRRSSVPDFPSMADLQKSNKHSPKHPFAVVGTNEKGSLVVSHMNPKYLHKRVNIAGVMNRGSYTVTDFCPVSKAYNLFTTMGLRHLTVLGGESGGTVVGVVTRVDFVESVIEQKTQTLIE